MTPEQAIAKLKDLAKVGDWEAAHGDADQILCDLLPALGHEDVVKAWDDVGKWYS
jgi:hypothetical protein